MDTATSSKEAMGKALDGSDAIIENLTDNTKGLPKALAAVVKKITDAAGQDKATITKTEYEAVGTEVGKITKIIDDTLAEGGLTQLDTSNLKALRSSVTDLEKAFENIDGMTKNGNDYEVAKADFDKVKAAIDKITESSKEAGASATKALDSSKAQAENIKEMRRLRGILCWLYFKHMK